MTAGHTYTFTKYVDVESSQEAGDTLSAAREGAAAAAGLGWKALLAENAAAWAKLWRGRIEVSGDPSLARKVNASQFYLWSSTNEGVDWSVSPAGLSSNGYNGHIFWDAETWMFPSLLAQHPELAAGMDEYRFQRLAAARAHASETGYRRRPVPLGERARRDRADPAAGAAEQRGALRAAHRRRRRAGAVAVLPGDRRQGVAGGKGLAGDQRCGRILGRPAAEGSGRLHIDHVTGPDEENPNVNDEAYTNVAARTVLEDATAAAKVLGAAAPARWSKVAAGLVVPVDRSSGSTRSSPATAANW